ncbi:NAD(P)/FAD-dependent oxidoreductase [Halobacterium litoreum]|uniref:FAD-dependent oxidoreductase n=1 Tax=Halobacterium litoreum TaxID=2039234 RepID=A0ABD5NI76_9EURY|nr:NAD(P)/FAD-dependent oxidoreductase [Halobacterium litoreum]UHH12479.1 FAD-dependent oxidoreductase [Halobacterium litoreum]
MTQRVAIVGGGPAGLTAATYTARAGLETTVFDADEPILARNAHLENVPGFPAGVNARTFLDATREQAERAGADFEEAFVERVESADEGFRVETAESGAFDADFVVAASWPDVSYLDGFDVERIDRGSKTMLDVDEFGRTGVEGLYAAGRIARQYHQAVVAAGHGATTGLTVVEDSDEPYYHDWVAPDGYFSGRGREVPPGCEEIEERERRERERESLERLEALSPADPPTQHPSVDGDDD